jgi:hypothetical protein
MSLSSLIVQREVATMREVEEALARQVIYGGDLATNLLEVAPVDEGALTQLIAEAMRLAPAPMGELPVAPERARLVPSETAILRGIVPLQLDGEVLVVAVVEPIPADVEEGLMFALGVAIDQRAAPAVRVRQAIARLYGAPLDRRMERLIARLSGLPTPPPMPAPPYTPPFGSPVARTPERSEGAGANANVARTPERSEGAGANANAKANAKANAPRIRTPSMPFRRQTAPGFPETPGPVSAPLAAPAPSDDSRDSIPPPTPVVSQRRNSLLQRDMPSGIRPGRRRRGPITFDLAKREAEEASDRDALLDLFFDFSRQFFDYAALFLVHGDIAEGRDAFGPGASRERVVGIGVPLDLPSLMSNAREQRTPLVAKAQADGLDAVLLADLQRPRDAEMGIVPLVVRTRAVAMLLGDCAEAGVDRESMQQLTTFAAIVGQALERIIVRRKLEGFVAVGRASDVGPPAPEAITAPPESPPRLQAASRIIPTSTMPPPPPNVATVRRMSGPPIPREEPDSPRRIGSLDPQGGGGREDGSAVPQLVDDLRVGSGIREDLDARALFDILGWETGAEEPEVPPPSSAIAVPLHSPPHGRTAPAEELPTVIVDLEEELSTMVDRVLSGEADDSAEAELLRQGERAMRVLMARFPGPVTFERARIASMPNPPRASECGPLLRLVARERKVALPFVLERLSDPDPETRGWATHLLCELAYDEAIPHVLARLRDPDACTRASAVQAIAAVARASPDEVRDAIKDLAVSADSADRAGAFAAMARLRQPAFVPDLMRALADGDERVVAAAHEALVQVTWQDFGSDALPWLKWWEQNGSLHRIEWLIDSLTNEVSEIRRGAGEELRAMTREYFGYSNDLPPRDRERAQQRYRDWWITEGRTRFRRR